MDVAEANATPDCATDQEMKGISDEIQQQQQQESAAAEAEPAVAAAAAAEPAAAAAAQDFDPEAPKNGASKRCFLKQTSAAEWIPRVKVESYLDRKIRMLQEEQGVKATLDETLGSSNRHVSRIERAKRAAETAARDATDTRKSALVQASWCRILKAAGIPYMSAALELQKAEKLASDAFKKAVALGVVLRTGTRSRTESVGASRNKITASLDTAFEVDEEVAAAVKCALQRFKDGVKPADAEQFEEPDTCENALKEISCNEPERQADKTRDVLTTLMLERLTSLEPVQRASLSSIVETRGLNALLREELYEQELGVKNGRGGLGDVLVKHISRLEAEKAAAKAALSDSAGFKTAAQRRKKNDNDGWGGLDFGSSLKRHVSKLEAEQAAWRQAETEARNQLVPAEASQQISA